MLIYNTTYHVEDGDVRNFLIWMTQHYIPTVLQSGQLTSPRLAEVLSHREEGASTFSLQWEVESSKVLHEWHTRQGSALNDGLTHKGVAGELGLMATFGRINISASVLTIAGQQWQGCVGVGIKL